MSGKAKTRKTFGTKLKDQQNDNKTFYNLVNQGTIMSSSNSAITAGSVGGGTVNTFAESDLQMNTYDIVGVDRLKFAIREGAGDVLTATEYGIEALYTSGNAYGMSFRVPATKSFFFNSGSGQFSFSDTLGIVTGEPILCGSLKSSFIDFDNIVSPSNPATNHVKLFADSDNSDHLTVRKSDGSEVDLEAGTTGANTTLSNLGTTAINADLDPATDNVRCLGSSTKRWDKLYTGDVWTTYLTGNTDGEVKLVGDFVPFTDNTYDLGSSTKEWKDLYLDGIAYIDGVTAGTISVTTFSTTGTSNLGDGDTDQVNFYGKTDWKTNVTASSATTGSREGYITIKINGTDKKLYYYA
jgi:hypothetical protein